MKWSRVLGVLVLIIGVDAHCAAPQDLDGIAIDAIEEIPSSMKHSLTATAGIYPFDPYYTGLLLGAAYEYRLNSRWAWEALNIKYAFSYEKSLTTELAQRFGVNPKKIDRMETMGSTSIVHRFVHGKLLLWDDIIRTFQLGALGGIGLTKSLQKSRIAVQLGVLVDVQIQRGFSVRGEIRDMIPFADTENMVTFAIGSSYSF